MTAKTYKAIVEYDGDWWIVSVEGLKGAHTQARRFDEVEPMAREVISLMTDTEPDSFDVDVVEAHGLFHDE